MKHKRQKHAKKVMTFYEKHFGLTPPYNILVDATFVKEALANKVNIWDQLPNYLCANVRLYTTTCALRELEAFGKLLYGPLKVMREYKVAACPHQTHGVDPVDCLRKTAKRSHPDYARQQSETEREKKGKKRQFFIATQHSTLANKARRIPGLPLLYLHGNAITLEKASEESKTAAGVVAQERLVPLHETERLPSLLEQEGLAPMDEALPLHKKKKLKGPNPLSVLRKKSRASTGRSSLARRERRKWRRVRKLKEPPEGRLEELMLVELALEAVWGDRGRVYVRKSVMQLKRELQAEL